MKLLLLPRINVLSWCKFHLRMFIYASFQAKSILIYSRQCFLFSFVSFDTIVILLLYVQELLTCSTASFVIDSDMFDKIFFPLTSIPLFSLFTLINLHCSQIHHLRQHISYNYDNYFEMLRTVNSYCCNHYNTELMLKLFLNVQKSRITE